MDSLEALESVDLTATAPKVSAFQPKARPRGRKPATAASKPAARKKPASTGSVEKARKDKKHAGKDENPEGQEKDQISPSENLQEAVEESGSKDVLGALQPEIETEKNYAKQGKVTEPETEMKHAGDYGYDVFPRSNENTNMTKDSNVQILDAVEHQEDIATSTQDFLEDMSGIETSSLFSDMKASINMEPEQEEAEIRMDESATNAVFGESEASMTQKSTNTNFDDPESIKCSELTPERNMNISAALPSENDIVVNSPEERTCETNNHLRAENDIYNDVGNTISTVEDDTLLTANADNLHLDGFPNTSTLKICSEKSRELSDTLNNCYSTEIGKMKDSENDILTIHLVQKNIPTMQNDSLEEHFINMFAETLPEKDPMLSQECQRQAADPIDGVPQNTNEDSKLNDGELICEMSMRINKKNNDGHSHQNENPETQVDNCEQMNMPDHSQGDAHPVQEESQVQRQKLPQKRKRTQRHLSDVVASSEPSGPSISDQSQIQAEKPHKKRKRIQKQNNNATASSEPTGTSHCANESHDFTEKEVQQSSSEGGHAQAESLPQKRKRKQKSLNALSGAVGPTETFDDGDFDLDEHTETKSSTIKGRRKASTKKNPKKQELSAKAEKPSKPKKFPHSTKRKLRRVEKQLLETPEADLDMGKLKIKDIIRLAEARERKQIKEAAARKKAGEPETTSEVVEANEPDDFEGSAFVPQVQIVDGRVVIDESSLLVSNRELHSTYRRVEETTSTLNYGTYMNRRKSDRWSKSDTELFYKAMQQFGTNFEMIQRLFPGRTRNQVKAKFKIEEKKHPLMLSDALLHRPQDYSHYQTLIDQLKISSSSDHETISSLNFSDDCYIQNSNKDDEAHVMTDEVNITADSSQTLTQLDKVSESSDDYNCVPLTATIEDNICSTANASSDVPDVSEAKEDSPAQEIVDNELHEKPRKSLFSYQIPPERPKKSLFSYQLT